MNTTIRIGTRGSRLALAQANWVSDRLREAHGDELVTELVIVKTRGDKLQHLALAKLDDKGFFTKEIEQALLDGRIDVAVHSLKDLPSEQPPGLELAAIPVREDPADLLLLNGTPGTGAGLRDGLRLGTSSIRRQLQASEQESGVELVEVRGNVPTRLERLREGRIDGLVLASAGVRRLGLDTDDLSVERLDPSVFVPAPGQGALGLQIRDGDSVTRGWLEPLNDEETAVSVEAERWLLQKVGGGCNLPLGAWVRKEGEEFVFSACLGSRGWRPGQPPVAARVTVRGRDPMGLSRTVWASLEEHWKDEPVAASERVVLTATQAVAERQARALRGAGIGVVAAPLIETEATLGEEAIEAALSALWANSWIVLTSTVAAAAFLGRVSLTALAPTTRFAAIGPSTAREIRQRGLQVEWVATESTSEGFVSEFPACQQGQEKQHFLFPCAEGARTVVPDALRAAGHEVVRLPFYRSRPAPEDSVRAALAMDSDFLVFSSPSAVKAFCALGVGLEAVPIALGPTTAAAIREHGLAEPLVAARPNPEALVELIIEARGEQEDAR
ncbi:MAG: hydroxymethylbilane synthase [Myxococcota bacterium]|nr:hydroxymethylbilane synthase [Myxococcota bacterium]